MDEYLIDSDTDDEIELSSNKDNKEENDLEKEFNDYIDNKISNDHNIEVNKIKTEKKEENFYDPEEDELDEEYVKDLISSNHVENELPTQTDATLNCPNCMVMLSLSCQRHVKYHNQYRAMFVYNCTVDKDKKIHYAESLKKQKKNKQNDCVIIENNNEDYYQVYCTICSAEIGVIDNDEIYHFYNVIASY